jgi:hypothetical protein
MFIGYLARLDVAVEADRRPLDGPCTTGSARKSDRMASAKFLLRDERLMAWSSSKPCINNAYTTR